MSITVRPKTGTHLQKISIKLPSGLRFKRSYFSKRNISKHVKVRARGKTLGRQCFRRTRWNRFQVDHCITRAAKIEITFRTGSLVASKRYKKDKSEFKLTAKDTRRKMRAIVPVG